MRSVHRAVPLVVILAFTACQLSDEDRAPRDPVSPSAPGLVPDFSAAATRFPQRFFFLQDFARDYSATIGLVSPISDLGTDPNCGGSGPEVYDGGGTETVIATGAGFVHLRDRWQNATLVLYEGAANDVCELVTHPVLARGRVNFSFVIHHAGVTDGSVSFQVQVTGIVDLTSGGRAHLLIRANFVVDNEGNVEVHVDRFALKPIGGE
jgi:hypothetical protein